MSRGRENQPRWGKKFTFRDMFKCEADTIVILITSNYVI